MNRTAKRAHMTRVLSTLQRAQRHYDRLPAPDQAKVDSAKAEAVKTIVAAFVGNTDAADANAVASAKRFTECLLAECERVYSVVEIRSLEALRAMDASLLEAAGSATDARFSNNAELEAKQETTAKNFYHLLGKHALEVVNLHGAEFILSIARTDLDYLRNL